MAISAPPRMTRAEAYRTFHCCRLRPTSRDRALSIDTKAVGSAVIFLGGGRQRVDDTIDPAVGIAQIANVGQSVDSGIPLAYIHAASESAWERAAALLKSSFQIGPEQNAGLPVIYARVEGEQSYESS